MKRLWPTLLLVVICIGGFWYASSKDFFKEKKDEPKQVFTVKKEDVAGFSMQNGDSAIELQQKDNVWTMTKPSPIPLNDFSAESWIDSFNLTTKDKTVEDNPSDLAKYGLDKPSQKFTVTMKDGSSKVISVGDPVPIPGFFYALASGSGEVFRLSEQQVTSLNKQQLDFMEKSPIHTNYDQVTSLSVDWKGVKWTLTKTEADKKSYDANWKIGDRELKGADASNVLDKAIYLATDQLVKAASTVKMDAPELRIEVKETDSGKETVTVYTGKSDGDNVWIAKQGGEWAYAIPAASMQELSDMGTKTPDQTAK
ncbi:DUF4340 domain-containing protein [Paenibacillus thalictri]|uniref:DUF4340 domain-containing protein n=1 Tax=Paenibacillus thalictri TaxID=2527873 RepID=A0A4Q9DMQ0_9BACL|nr:DUF4340 domain-containing protein [Paenibacillus thalictri]TBL73066.1 DUF4340 domain-containing protein [Paenibacillus thalictri]